MNGNLNRKIFGIFTFSGILLIICPATHGGPVGFNYFDSGSQTPFFIKDSIPFWADLNVDENEIKLELDLLAPEGSKEYAGKKSIHRLIRFLRIKKKFRDKKLARRLYRFLAKESASLKLYPQAMAFYAKALEPDDGSIKLDEGSLALIDSIKQPEQDDEKVESRPTTISDLVGTFSNNKRAFAYAIILHVKQPVPGKRNAFNGLDNVGHTFITLIKYNSDQSVDSRSFGFYPDKNSNISATPLHPGAPSVFKDDGSHDWDEVIGKFISRRRFDKIIRLLDKYENKHYDLNESNCTDFGLNAAALCGIQIFQTENSWPLGRGNNPASAGQSILEGKLLNTDTMNQDELFLSNSILK